MTEYPNEKIAESFFDFIAEDTKASFAIGFMEKKMGKGFFKKKIYDSFNPSLDGISTKNYGWEAIITRDNLKLAEEREGSSRFISSLISKFLNNEPREKESGAGGFLKGFFSKALTLLLERLKPESDDESSENTIELSDDIITFLDNQD